MPARRSQRHRRARDDAEHEPGSSSSATNGICASLSPKATCDLVVVEQRARELDLLSEVARHFIAVVAAQQRQRFAQEATALARRTLDAITERVDAARSPVAEQSRARIALTRALWKSSKPAASCAPRVSRSRHFGASRSRFSAPRMPICSASRIDRTVPSVFRGGSTHARLSLFRVRSTAARRRAATRASAGAAEHRSQPWRAAAQKERRSCAGRGILETASASRSQSRRDPRSACAAAHRRMRERTAALARVRAHPFSALPGNVGGACARRDAAQRSSAASSDRALTNPGGLRRRPLLLPRACDRAARAVGATRGRDRCGRRLPLAQGRARASNQRAAFEPRSEAPQP